MWQIIAIPFIGTTLGAACVFLFRKQIGAKMQRALTGFASGVMVAASFFSLILPALDQTGEMGKLGFIPVSIGFAIGMLFLPLAHIKVDMPFNSIDTNVSVLNLAMDVIAKFEFSILNAAPLAAIIFYALSILGVLVAAVFAILNIPFVSVSCSPKGFKRNVRLSIGGIVGMLISIISFFIFNAQLESMYGAMYSGNIGDGSVIGAGSVVTQDLPENVTAVGSPVMIVRKDGVRIPPIAPEKLTGHEKRRAI